MRITAMPTDPRRPHFFCPTCLGAFQTAEAAERCMNDNESQIAKVGEIVLVKNGYSWFDGDPAWVVGHGGYDFNGRKTHAMWYVVSSIVQAASSVDRPNPFNQGRSAHEWCYVLWTKGLKNGDEQGRCGWTSRTHIGFTRPALKLQPPASVIQEATTMIGRTTSHLL